VFVKSIDFSSYLDYRLGLMKRLLTSCLGLGWMPIAPGTWGSLPPMIVFGVLGQLAVSPMVIVLVMMGLTVLGSVLCLALAPGAIAATGNKDPGEVVADELAGQSVCYLVAPLVLSDSLSVTHIWLLALAGFLCFRVFDIFKPWPARQLEGLPAGWGILADDLMAGVYAGIVLWGGVCLFGST
jgi:phosphatidylglycerophosphatase A